MENRMKAQILDIWCHLDLKKCLYIPECARNLVFVAKLDNIGFDFKVRNDCFSL